MDEDALLSSSSADFAPPDWFRSPFSGVAFLGICSRSGLFAPPWLSLAWTLSALTGACSPLLLSHVLVTATRSRCCLALLVAAPRLCCCVYDLLALARSTIFSFRSCVVLYIYIVRPFVAYCCCFVSLVDFLTFVFRRCQREKQAAAAAP